MRSTKLIIFKNLKIFILLFCLICSFSKHGSVHAQATKGISVTPSVLKIDLSKEKPESVIKYRNTSNDSVDLNLSAENFTITEGNKINFLTNEESVDYKYSLSQAITFDTISFTLNPGDTKDIHVFINSKILKPGSHFASIQAEIAQKQSESNVTVGGILSNLTIVKSFTGKEVEEGLVENFSFSKRISNIPTEYSFKFINKGNVELTPFGILNVKDSFGKSIGKGVLNENSLMTLPESARTYTIPIEIKDRMFFPGYYSADLIIRYASTEKEIHQSVKFFTFGSKYFLTSFIIILMGIFGILLMAYKFKFKRRSSV